MVAQQLLLEDECPCRIDVLRPVLSLPGERTGELGVEQRQGGLDAAERLGLGDRRVVDGRRLPGGREQRHGRLAGLRAGAAEAREPAAEIAEDLTVLERGTDRLFERQFPDVVEARVRERQRLDGSGRFIEWRLVAVGILEFLDRPHVVRQIAIFKKVERLPRRTAARDEREARDGHPELSCESLHGGHRRGPVVSWSKPISKCRRCAQGDVAAGESGDFPTRRPPTPCPHRVHRGAAAAHQVSAHTTRKLGAIVKLNLRAGRLGKPGQLPLSGRANPAS